MRSRFLYHHESTKPVIPIIPATDDRPGNQHRQQQQEQGQGKQSQQFHFNLQPDQSRPILTKPARTRRAACSISGGLALLAAQFVVGFVKAGVVLHLAAGCLLQPRSKPLRKDIAALGDGLRRDPYETAKLGGTAIAEHKSVGGKHVDSSGKT